MSAPYSELVRPLEVSQAQELCRGCLVNSSEMKDMFEWGLAGDFSKFANVKVESTELLTHLLCPTCEETLQRFKQFQTQCYESDILLRNLAKRNTKALPASIEIIDENYSTSYVMSNDKLVVMITAKETECKIYLVCPYECENKFLKKQDLFHHLIKNHQINDNTFTVELKYYCRHVECLYHALSDSAKWFSGRKYLNQHYNKVHKSKIYACIVCNKKYATVRDFNNHLQTCNMTYTCQVCESKYNTNEKLLVHLMRRHPDFHKRYKEEKKAHKRKAKVECNTKKIKIESERLANLMCDSPKRSSSTQTLKPEENIKNDVSLTSCNPPLNRNDYNEAKTDEISTQTVFEDLLSIKSQTSEDESIFFSETVSLSDIQTQTFPLEFGLSRSNKETLTSETQSPDLSIKETQTCVCLYDSPKISYRLFDSISSSPSSTYLTSTETQTGEMRLNMKSDVLLGFNSAETQTCFKEEMDKDI